MHVGVGNLKSACLLQKKRTEMDGQLKEAVQAAQQARQAVSKAKEAEVAAAQKAEAAKLEAYKRVAAQSAETATVREECTAAKAQLQQACGSAKFQNPSEFENHWILT